MRRIMQMILECALEENKADNAKVANLREAYRAVDGLLSHDPEQDNARLAEALVVADFPLYFGRTISAALYDRYNMRQGTWKQYTYADQVPNYLQANRYRMGEFDSNLDTRREKEESYADYFTEARVQVAVTDFAKQVDFDRQILQNDDLGAFNRVPTMLGDAARRFEDVFVSALYDNALTQAALIALGVGYGGTGRLTTANLAIAYNAFVTRTDARGNVLNIAPRFLVIPPILAMTASVILMSDRIAELATNGRNPFGPGGGYKLTVVEDPYIATAAPNIPWYLFADPADIPGVTVARMQGVSGPQLYIKAPDKLPLSTSGAMGSADWRRGSFTTGDIEIEVETTIGTRSDSLGTWVGVSDPNGIYYSSGTTP
jgi:hypothetical protein